jgi:hypothetical protein
MNLVPPFDQKFLTGPGNASVQEFLIGGTGVSSGCFFNVSAVRAVSYEYAWVGARRG